MPRIILIKLTINRKQLLLLCSDKIIVKKNR